jgi:hypothetical protein
MPADSYIDANVRFGKDKLNRPYMKVATPDGGYYKEEQLKSGKTKRTQKS